MLSVVLAVHNEEKNLARCLQAISDLADEIVIVDGESTDQTKKIAIDYGARVISTTNKTNFHINKQMAMDQAKGDLVLQLDADEVVDDELKTQIRKLRDRYAQNPEVVKEKAWWLKRKNFFLGRFLRKGGQYPDPVIRLYINGFARLPQQDVHEQMVVDGRIGEIKGHLLHYANPSFSDYLNKWDRYTSFKAQQLDSAKVQINIITGANYLFFKPLVTTWQIFVRHKGFVDGFAGLIFAVFSGLHHYAAYLKLWELKRQT